MLMSSSTSEELDCFWHEKLPGGRNLFHVELQGDTPTISWPKLAKLMPSQLPAPEKQGNVNIMEKNCKAMMEKLEDIYKGCSSDEESAEAKHPEQYNSDDSFIDDGELNDYFEVQSAKTRHKGFYINKGALECTSDAPARKAPLRSFQKRKPKRKEEDGVEPKKVKLCLNQEQEEITIKKVPRGVVKVEPLAERINSDEVPSLKDSREDTKKNPRVTSLDRAIQELEKGVAEFSPPSTDNKEETKGKRLHREVKARLAKVARLAQKKNKLTDEKFISGLMNTLGHLMQLKTLKKHLKEMVELGLTAQKEKQDKLDAIKLEIRDMVQERLPFSALKTTQEPEAPKQIPEFAWDTATEDRLHDLYEIYVQELDEPKNAPSKRFYSEVVALWPEGYMERSGIKSAVSRAKERRKGAMKQAKVEEKKRKPVNKPVQVKKEKSSSPSSSPSRKPGSAFEDEKVVLETSVCDEVGFGLRRDRPQEEEVMSLRPSSLRQIKKQLSSNRFGVCSADERPPPSLVWMINDPQEQV